MAHVVLGSALLALTAAAATGGPSAQDAVLYVCVSAGDPASGFVEPDAKDSARDLSESLRKRKFIRLVDDRGKADVWIRVDKRFKRGTGGAIATGGGATVGVAEIEDQVVSATLIAGDYSTEIVGADWYSWKSAAGKLAGNVEKWLKENKEQLLSRRPKQ